MELDWGVEVTGTVGDRVSDCVCECGLEIVGVLAELVNVSDSVLDAVPPVHV